MKYIKVFGILLFMFVIVFTLYVYMQSKKTEDLMGGNTGICGSGGEFC